MVCIFSVKYMSSADWEVRSLGQVGGVKRGEGLNFSYHGEQERDWWDQTKGFLEVVKGPLTGSLW